MLMSCYVQYASYVCHVLIWIIICFYCQGAGLSVAFYCVLHNKRCTRVTNKGRRNCVTVTRVEDSFTAAEEPWVLVLGGKKTVKLWIKALLYSQSPIQAPQMRCGEAGLTLGDRMRNLVLLRTLASSQRSSTLRYPAKWWECHIKTPPGMRRQQDRLGHNRLLGQTLTAPLTCTCINEWNEFINQPNNIYPYWLSTQ